MEIILHKAGGPRYRTRDGRPAVVLESNVCLKGGGWRRIWQGRVGGEWVEWERGGEADGRHTGGDSGLDLVGEAT